MSVSVRHRLYPEGGAKREQTTGVRPQTILLVTGSKLFVSQIDLIHSKRGEISVIICRTTR